MPTVFASGSRNFAEFSTMADTLSPQDIDILKEFYDATNGAQWTVTWSFSDDYNPCNFHGIVCTNEVNADGFLDVLSFGLPSNNLVGSVPESFYDLTTITFMDLSENRLHGTLSEKVGFLSQLGTIYLDTNSFSGSLPSALSTLASIWDLDVSHNQFTGRVDHAFNPDLQRFFNVISLEDNQFTGTIPRSLTTLPNLSHLTLNWNCFHGPIPESFCETGFYQYLYMTGANSGEGCRTPFISFFGASSFLLKHKFTGTIPSCLFEIPNLIGLKMDGLGLSARLPDVNFQSDQFINLYMRDNALYGTIPHSFQIHNFETFDLQHNKISGELDRDINPPMEFSLRYNRLSGFVPSAVVTISDYAGSQEILEGNSFDCNADRSDLPYNDAYYSRYQDCGSSNFNTTLYQSMGVACGTLLLIVLAFGINKCFSTSPLKRVFDLLGKFRTAYCEYMTDTTYHQWNGFVRRWVCVLTALILILLVPLWVTLSAYYATQTYKYAWVVSGVYLNGVVATVCMLCVVLLLCGSVYWSMRRSGVSFGVEKWSYSMRECWSVTKLAWMLVVFLVVVGNVILVVSVNTSYVAAARLANQKTFQKISIAMSVFKILWNFLILRNILKVLTFKSPISNYRIQQHWFTSLETSLVLFNNIIAPYVAILFASENCLQEVFVQTSSFAFMYSFQCSSTFITTYANVFLFMFALTAVGFPVIQGVLMALHFGVNPYRKDSIVCAVIIRMLCIVQPKLLFPDISVDESDSSSANNEATEAFLLVPESANEDATAADAAIHEVTGWKRVLAKRLFCADLMVVDMVSMFAIMLTFGAVVPAVAFLGCCAVLSQTLFNELMIGRGLHKVDCVYGGDVVKVSRFRQELLVECRSFGDLFRLNIFIIVPFVVVFYGLLVFDMLGDTEGTDRAIWAPVAVMLVVVGLSLLARYGSSSSSNSSSGGGVRSELRKSYEPLISGTSADVSTEKGEVEVNPLL